jgi:CBS domain-containing protein
MIKLAPRHGCNPATNVLVFDSGMLARREAIMAEHRRLSGHTDERKMAVMETISSVLQRKGNQVWQVSPEATVFEAIAEMADKGVGALPVVLHNELVGIISERDYARKVILQGRSSQHTLVKEIMTPSPITVTPEFTVNQCLVIMTTGRVRYLPVMDRGGLAGIISIGDLVHAIIATQAFTIDQLQTYISADYPA